LAKKNLKLSLLLMDAVIFLIILVSIYFLFDLVIKKILIRYNIEKFYESMRTTQFDLSNSVSYIEEKKELEYKKFIIDIFDYLKLSTLKRAKYDNSIIAFIFPEEENLLIIGKRNDIDIKFDKKNIEDYEYFKNEIEKSKTNIQSELKIKEYVTFNFKGKKYIGIANYSEIGIRKKLLRDNNELVSPIIVIADRDDEFFYLIYLIRNVFFLILGIVFAIGAVFKLYNTYMITNEIYGIRDNMQSVINDIKSKGMISAKIKKIITKFIETSNLDDSFLGLVKSLEDLGDIISGIADRDLFIATLKNDDSLLKPHDEMMTIMFLDIQGFTTITEKYKNNIINIINSIWTEVEHSTAKYHGKINKLIGDAALIIFREEINGEKVNSSKNAFYASIETLLKVPKICNDLNLDVDFNFRIGLDYGKITYGKTGTENNYELGVIGDTVNTAARLEALSKQYHTNLLITENVYDELNIKMNQDYNIKEELNINDDLYINLFNIDKARPKGKKEAKEIITVLLKNENNYSFIGSNNVYKNEYFTAYTKLLNNFLNSISYWQKYQKSKINDEGKHLSEETKKLRIEAFKAWSSIAKNFAKLYLTSEFPVCDNFIKTILKYEEYEDFKSSTDEWLKKEIYQVKEPSEDWIKLGTMELEK